MPVPTCSNLCTTVVPIRDQDCMIAWRRELPQHQQEHRYATRIKIRQGEPSTPWHSFTPHTVQLLDQTCMFTLNVMQMRESVFGPSTYMPRTPSLSRQPRKLSASSLLKLSPAEVRNLAFPLLGRYLEEVLEVQCFIRNRFDMPVAQGAPPPLIV